MAAIAQAVGFTPALWFGEGAVDWAPDAALAAALEDGTMREILEEVLRMGPRDRRLLPGIAREIQPSAVVRPEGRYADG